MNTNQKTETSGTKPLKILIILTLSTLLILQVTGIVTIRLDVDSAHLSEKLAALTGTTAVEKQNSQTVNQTDDILPEHHDSVTLVIPPKQQLSYWLAMERDYDLDYSWTTDGKPVYGELRGKGKDVNSTDVKVFAKTTSDKAHGFFIIPFAGQFGWHWDNKTDQAITVHFNIKGAYKILDRTGRSTG